MAKEDNSFGTASVVLGIIGIIFSSMIGVILGIIGLVFAKKQNKIMKTKWAKVGLILNIISIILGLAVFTYAMVALLNNPDFLAQIQQAANA